MDETNTTPEKMWHCRGNLYSAVGRKVLNIIMMITNIQVIPAKYLHHKIQKH